MTRHAIATRPVPTRPSLRARPLSRLLSLGALLSAHAGVWAANEAEIVLLIGQGERRDTPDAAWAPAAVKQTASAGVFVRTLANSQMGLLMSDRTQIRLNQNSQLQIKPATGDAPAVVQLNAGRAWSQARPQTQPGAPAGPARPPSISMQTPSATLSIRGTDWEVEVGPDGSTQLVVLSGTVEMFNAFGTVTVGRSEAATAEIGKAPVKLQLVRPQTRVQWVSSWRPQPRRWVAGPSSALDPVIAQIEAGRYAEAESQLSPLAGQDVAAARLLADLLLQRGDVTRAIAVLAPHARDGAGDADTVALQAYALARDDQRANALTIVDTALKREPRQPTLLLARAELLVLDGQADAARSAYTELLGLQPQSAEPWYGLGLIASERDDVRVARSALGEALKRDPALSKATAELASAESFAGELPRSDALLDSLLQREPDNYVALTARGLNRLKSGQPRAALDDFLKAGLIEPRYARAWLYSGVAFYQLGETERALQAFRKTTELDPRDPAPHVYESLVQADALDFGSAIDSARLAQEKMPFLRSLNQVANDQKGSANVGSALAQFGMEEWSAYYAAEAYSPYWAGSHLFLADRQLGKFNKNSELFKGFLTDPTVFGASNRRSSLVAVPGHYGRIDTFYARDEYAQLGATVSLNGLTQGPTPISYSLSFDRIAGEAFRDDSTAQAKNLTAGFGIRPRHDIGLFAFATDSTIDAWLRMPEIFPRARLLLQEKRGDVGANFKISPENQVWVKAGYGRLRHRVAGDFISQATADSYNELLGPGVVSPLGILDEYDTGTRQRDLQLRQSFTAGAAQWTWGLERSRQEQSVDLLTTFFPIARARREGYTSRSTDAYLSAKLQKPDVYAFQADLFAQDARITQTDINAFGVIGFPDSVTITGNTALERHYQELNPRLGFKWDLAPLQSLRAVAQRWRRPSSVGTLAPIDTVGVPMNDRLVLVGGLYERARLQFDGEVSKSRFAQAFVDYERIDNNLAGIRTGLADFDLTQLEHLLNRPEVFSPRNDLEDIPQFDKGHVTTVGLAMNQLLSRSHAVSVRYLWRKSAQTGANSGLMIPYVPRNFLQLGSQWSLPDRWLLGANATYRSKRFEDDVNLEPVRAGWAFGLTVYWESADKRHGMQALVDNLLSRSRASVDRDPRVLLRYSYRL
jgi:Flp pilus assembly protein TadD